MVLLAYGGNGAEKDGILTNLIEMVQYSIFTHTYYVWRPYILCMETIYIMYGDFLNVYTWCLYVNLVMIIIYIIFINHKVREYFVYRDDHGQQSMRTLRLPMDLRTPSLVAFR